MDYEDFIEQGQDLLDAHGYQDFEIVDDSVIRCPCGHSIEWDGQCPDGCRSPMLALGII